MKKRTTIKINEAMEYLNPMISDYVFKENLFGQNHKHTMKAWHDICTIRNMLESLTGQEIHVSFTKKKAYIGD